MSITTAHQKDTLEHRLATLAPFVGRTPLFPIQRAYQKEGVRIFAKLEWMQMGQSVKSRPGFQIISDAILEGHLRHGMGLLDATSGNTGIAYATFGAALGIPVTLCLPENASEERKTILRSLGVNIIFTSRFEGTDGAQEKAKEIAAANPEQYFYADQYANDNNWKAHFEHTGPEIIEQTEGRITHFVAGLGTTGTFTGTGRKLKEWNPSTRLIGLQPNTPMHGLEGWKHLETAIVPKIYDPLVPDDIHEVDTAESYEVIKKVAADEGLLLSPSSAANLLGAMKVADSINEGVVVTVFPDNGDKYQEVFKNLFG
ncbi:MAG: cysteine synthase family protein [Flavobacteriales bacterium]|nr:cysteine synthase family protein [Flavobacteriales bacterium]